MVKSSASQKFVPIKEIHSDGTIVLKDGAMKAVLMTSSLNMELKSSDEQESTVYNFRNFLNALEFSVQIVIQSRRIDIGPYLKLLEERLYIQKSELLRVQTEEYISFIKEFTNSHNIMRKHFFVVVSYSSSILAASSQKNFIDRFLPSGRTASKIKKNEEERFEEKISQLEQRVGLVQAGLEGFGVRSVRLAGIHLEELFYEIFNPGETQRGLDIHI